MQPVLLGLLCAALTGCGEQDGFFVEQSADKAGEAMSDPVQGASGEAMSDPVQKASGEAKGDSEPTVQRQSIYVQVSGDVSKPGVYELSEGSRIFEAIALAGGLNADADGRRLNQALPLTDGQMIYVYQEGEACIALPDGALAGSTSADAAGAGSAAGTEQPGGKTAGRASGNAGAEESAADGRINLNTASAEQLTTLPGIGQAKANSILAYRETHGAFGRIEEIMEIEGIKEGVFSKIKDRIKVD